MHRIKGDEFCLCKSLQSTFVLQSLENGFINGVLILFPRGQAGHQQDFLVVSCGKDFDIAKGQFILGQGAGFIRAEDIHGGHFLNGFQPSDNRLFFRQQHGAHCHSHG